MRNIIYFFLFSFSEDKYVIKVDGIIYTNENKWIVFLNNKTYTNEHPDINSNVKIIHVSENSIDILITKSGGKTIRKNIGFMQSLDIDEVLYEEDEEIGDFCSTVPHTG